MSLRTAPRFIAWLLVILLGTGATTLPALAADSTPALTDAQRQAKAKELERLRQRITAMRKELDTLRGQHDAARQALQQVEKAIGQRVRSLRDTAQQLTGVEKRLGTLHGEQTRLRAKLARQRALLARQVRAAFAIGRQEYLKLLLNQQDPAAMGRVMTYYDYFNRARAKRIRAALATLDQLHQVEADIQTQSATLQALQNRQQQDKQKLEASYKERARVVASLRAQLSSKGQQLARMVENEKHLDRLLRAINEALADIPADPGNRKPFPQLKGRLPWPTQGKIRDLYGHPRLGTVNWKGAIIQAPEGRAVRAVSHGRVAFADWLRGYGLLMIIDHGNGYMTLYGHNQALYKETGDWVEPGDVIATVGDSGGANQAGLYFEIRHNGRPVDPGRWCRRGS